VKPNIYIPNSGCHDFSAAKHFGKLITLSKGALNLYSIGGLYRLMEPILLNSTKEDYILICGPTVANVVATTIFTHLHGKLNLLIYHVDKKGKGRYKRRNISYKNRRSLND